MNRLHSLFRTAATVLLAIAVCLGVGWAIYRDAAEASQQGPTAATKDDNRLVVEYVGLQRRALTERVALVGSLVPNAEVQVRARTGGYITALPFDLGDRVDRGEMVIRFDDSEQQEAVASAAAAVQVIQAQLKARSAKHLEAGQLVQRLKTLEASGVSTPQQQDAALAALAIAAAEVELEQARLAQAESDLARSRLALEETSLPSPISGFVGERLVDVGDLANPNEPLLRIVDLASVHTEVHVVERSYTRIEVGVPAIVEVDALPDEQFRGTVIRKAPVLDPQTRTAAVQIEIPNPGFRLKPGMYARVSLLFDAERSADVVPVAAVVKGAGESKVFLAEGGEEDARVRAVTVETGLTDGEFVEILSPIEEDARIITLGSRMVVDGQQVRAVSAPPLSPVAHVEPEPGPHGAAE